MEDKRVGISNFFSVIHTLEKHNDLGVIAVPFFANGQGIFWTSEGWKILAVNLLGLVVIIAWAGMYFYIL